LALDRSCNLGSEVGLFLLDALAESEADEAGDLRRSADFLLGFLKGLLDGNVRVHDESLLQQHDFLVELAHAAFDHLLDDVLRLAGLASLGREDFLLAGNGGRIDLFSGQSERAGSSNVHRDLTAESSGSVSIARSLDSNENAELAEAVRNRVVDI